MDRKGHVGRTEGGNYGVCQTLSQLFKKKGVNGHNPRLLGAERVQGRAERGPRMPEYQRVTADENQFV